MYIAIHESEVAMASGTCIIVDTNLNFEISYDDEHCTCYELLMAMSVWQKS